MQSRILLAVVMKLGNPGHTPEAGGYEGERLRIAQNTNNEVPVYNPGRTLYRERVTEYKSPIVRAELGHNVRHLVEMPEVG
jgi:hypothetical protein